MTPLHGYKIIRYKGKGKGKGKGYSLKSTLTCSADFTSTFPGIGTHTNTISSPLEECSAM